MNHLKYSKQKKTNRIQFDAIGLFVDKIYKKNDWFVCDITKNNIAQS